jgi:ribosomal protein S18 acetylase RimI-like enzyme
MATIRPAENRDIPDVLNLLVQVNLVHHNGRPDLFKGPATKYNAEELKAIFADGSRPVFVYDESGRVLGYAFCVFQQHVGSQLMTDIKTLYIDDLCVDEEKRGQSIGRQLYEHVLAWARAAGYYNVTLNVWSCNGEAMAFYRRMGMQPQKTGMEVIL